MELLSLCDGNIEKNHNNVNANIPQAALWAVVQDKPMEYKQEDVTNVIAPRHGLIQKTLIPLNPPFETDKPEIWQLVSSITIWYIWT